MMEERLHGLAVDLVGEVRERVHRRRQSRVNHEKTTRISLKRLK
jgi:hypothetical protein